MSDCPFCAIVNDGAPATHLMPPQLDIIVIEPLNPITRGHALVIPKVHVTDFAHHPDTSAMTMRWAAWYARSVGDCNIITSIGPAATQTVRHLHVHVVPRRPGDRLPLPWSEPDRRSGAKMACGCWWGGIQSGQGVGLAMTCPRHGPTTVAQANVDEPKSYLKPNWLEPL